jgi:hypothetical protein
MDYMRYLIFFLLALFLLGPIWLIITNKVDLNSNWQTASRRSSGLAPSPTTYSPAVIQVYMARTYNWRGLFATHTWIAMKPKDAKTYTVYQVIGWRQFMSLPVLSIAEDIPDRFWFGQKPTLLQDIQGQVAEKIIPQIEQAVHDYPYKNVYHVWPGPNSNSFPAYIARRVPDLHLLLPPITIGKDYLGDGSFFAHTPSGTGWQFSFYGLFGIAIGKEEGLEINFLGLVFGINFKKLAIIWPGIGWIGFRT